MMKKILYFVFVVLSLASFACSNQTKQGSMVALDVKDEQENGNDAVVHSFTDHKNVEVFKPTSEWQDLKTGQAIPAGLHVQVDLQTGKKQAKLMDGDDGERYRQHEKAKYLKSANQGKEKLVKFDNKVFTKQELKKAFKDFKDKFHDDKGPTETPNKDNKFRSIEEIRKELGDVDLFPKRDIEFIKEHVAVINNSTSTIHEKIHALDELEFLLHQTDNAVDFNTIGGLELVIKLLNSTQETLINKAAYVIGSATQSNLPVQKAAQKLGAIPLLIRVLSTKHVVSVHRKALFALSSIIRLYSNAQQEFLKLNGLELFHRILTESYPDVLKIKVITLTTDMLTEQFNYIKSKIQDKKDIDVALKQIPLLKAMVKQGWCEAVQRLLSIYENDTREKIFQALDALIVGCKEQFHISKMDQTLSLLYTELEESIKLADHEKEYLEQLLEHVTRLRNMIR